MDFIKDEEEQETSYLKNVLMVSLPLTHNAKQTYYRYCANYQYTLKTKGYFK